jgi:hypothetical protein
VNALLCSTLLLAAAAGIQIWRGQWVLAVINVILVVGAAVVIGKKL